MAFIIGLLTLILVLDCIALVFLVLIQLPKKDAGAGLAFGGSATDALFGAGSGNVLTRVTKYAATIFFVLAIVLSIMQSRFHTRSTTGFQKKLEQSTAMPPAAPLVPAADSTAAAKPAAEAPAAPATPAPATPPPATPPVTPPAK